MAGEAGAIGLVSADERLQQRRRYVWIKWHPEEKTQTLVVEPTFATEADRVGIIIPTPTEPQWLDMAPEFFVGLSVVSRLEPLPRFVRGPYRKLGDVPYPRNADLRAATGVTMAPPASHRIIAAGDTETLAAWLAQYGRPIGPLAEVVDSLAKQAWHLTLIDVDVSHLPPGGDRAHAGGTTPVGVSFSTDKPVYPVRLAGGDGEAAIDHRIFLHAPTKHDLAHPQSYLHRWAETLRRASKIYKTKGEAFPPAMRRTVAAYRSRRDEFVEQVRAAREMGIEPARLLYGHRMLGVDIGNLARARWPRARDLGGDLQQVLKSVSGHLVQGWYLAAIAKSLRPPEMRRDIPIVSLEVPEMIDASEHTFVLPREQPPAPPAQR